jgi:hypothetical protein
MVVRNSQVLAARSLYFNILCIAFTHQLGSRLSWSPRSWSLSPRRSWHVLRILNKVVDRKGKKNV